MSEKCKVKCDCHDDDDTKPVDGLGEATEWHLADGVLISLKPHPHGEINDLAIYVNAQPRDLVREQALLALLLTYLNNYDALTQRVKVLEEALGKIANYRCKCVIDDCECSMDIPALAREALAPFVGEKETPEKK